MRYVSWKRHKDAMNQLNVSLQHSIMTLAAHGWSHRRIARELDIHRETVGRHLRLAGSKPAKVLTGSAPDPAAKPAIPLTGGLAAGRQSLCLPWQAVIESVEDIGVVVKHLTFRLTRVAGRAYCQIRCIDYM